VSHLDLDTIALIALGEQVDSQDTAHVSNCAKCQSALDELRAVVATARSITDSDRLVSPPESVWDGIAQAVDAPTSPKSPDSGVTEMGAASRAPQRRTGWFALAASVGVVIGGLGTFAAMELSASNTAPAVIAQASLEPLRDGEQPAQAMVQQVDGKDVLVVQTSGLPATDGFYEVWLLAPDAQSMVSVGMLDTNDSGSFPLPPGMDLNQYPVVDISLEHFDGDASHSADSVLRGKLEI
jgi:anti-sigma-K factor RskA